MAPITKKPLVPPNNGHPQSTTLNPGGACGTAMLDNTHQADTFSEVYIAQITHYLYDLQLGHITTFCEPADGITPLSTRPPAFQNVPWALLTVVVKVMAAGES
jgi:hypothetical protein